MNRTHVFVAAMCSLVVAGFVGIAAVGTVMKMERGRADRVKNGSPDDLISVPVAAKDIPIGRRVSKAEVKDYFVYKWFPREAVPPGAILDLKELADKRAMRTIHQGEAVGSYDVSARNQIDPPDGYVALTLPVSAEVFEQGTAWPGQKFRVLAVKGATTGAKQLVLPLFDDLLLLGVDAPECRLTFAVTPEQSQLLQGAVDGRATLRVQPRDNGAWLGHDTETTVILPPAKSPEDLRAFLAME